MTTWGSENLVGMGSEQAYAMASILDAGQVGSLNSDQLAGLATAVDDSVITNLSSDVLGAMVTSLDTDDIGTLEPGHLERNAGWLGW